MNNYGPIDWLLFQGFADLKREYGNLQEKLRTKGLSLATLEKLNRLKKEAEELIQETEEKAKRITGKYQMCNYSYTVMHRCFDWYECCQ